MCFEDDVEAHDSAHPSDAPSSLQDTACILTTLYVLRLLALAFMSLGVTMYNAVNEMQALLGASQSAVQPPVPVHAIGVECAGSGSVARSAEQDVSGSPQLAQTAPAVRPSPDDALPALPAPRPVKAKLGCGASQPRSAASATASSVE